MAVNLVSKESVDCVKVEETAVSDGYGGQITTYTDGVTFKAVVAPVGTSAAEMKVIADMEISTKAFRVFYENSVNLKLNDIFRIGTQFYKVRADGFNAALSASVRRSLTYAEKWEVPENEYTE